MIASERKLKLLIKKIILESTEDTVNLENTIDTNSSNQELQQKYLHDLKNQNQYLEHNISQIKKERQYLSYILDELKKVEMRLRNRR